MDGSVVIPNKILINLSVKMAKGKTLANPCGKVWKTRYPNTNVNEKQIYLDYETIDLMNVYREKLLALDID